MRFSKTGRTFTILLSFMIFLSCNIGDNLLDLPESAIEIKTVNQGDVIKSKSMLPLGIYYNPTEVDPEKGSVSFYDKTGRLLDEYPIDREKIEQVQILVPLPENSAAGLTEMVVQLESGEGVLKKHSVKFFIDNKDYEILSIESYPLVCYPGGVGLFTANIKTTEGADPWIRWSVSGIVAQTRHLSQGGERFLFEIPSEPSEGLEIVKVELFPQSLSESDSYLTTPLARDVRVFISRNQGQNEPTNLSEKGAYSLFHFFGETNDFSEQSPARLQYKEAPALEIAGGMFGFNMGGFSGFSDNRLLLPIKDGKLQPLSLSFILYMFSDFKAGDLVGFASDDGKFTLTVEINDDLQPVMVLKQNANLQTSVFPYSWSAGERKRFSLALIPGNNNFTAIWYESGEMVSHDTLFWDDALLLSEGRTIIGGSNGFNGILDEFGVYYRDSLNRGSPDDRIFFNAAREARKNRLILAQGFSGMYLPRRVQVSGDYDLEKGALRLPGGSIATISGLFLNEGLVQGELKFTDPLQVPVKVSIHSADQKGKELFVDTVAPGSKSYKVTITEKEGSFLIAGSGASRSIDSVLALNNELIVKVFNANSKQSEAFLASALFYQQ